MPRLSRCLAASASALILSLAVVVPAKPAAAGGPLDILAVKESAPGHSWQVIGAGLMEYFEIPPTAVDGTLQCSVANFLSGREDCSDPRVTSQYQALKKVVRGYWQYAGAKFGQSSRHLRWEETKVLSPEKLIHEIDFLRGVIAEVNPVVAGQEDSAPHVVLIVGTTGGPGDLSVIVNDPVNYPESANPYLEAGGRQLDAGGQYEVGYDEFRDLFKWSKTLFRVKPE